LNVSAASGSAYVTDDQSVSLNASANGILDVSTTAGSLTIGPGDAATGSDVTLSAANGSIDTSFGNVVAVSSLTFNSPTLVLGNATAGTSLNINSANATQAAGTTLEAAILVANVGTGSAILFNAGNDFDVISGSGSGTVTVNNVDSVNIGAFGTNNLTLVAGGAVDTIAINDGTTGGGFSGLSITGATVSISQSTFATGAVTLTSTDTADVLAFRSRLRSVLPVKR